MYGEYSGASPQKLESKPLENHFFRNIHYGAIYSFRFSIAGLVHWLAYLLVSSFHKTTPTRDTRRLRRF